MTSPKDVRKLRRELFRWFAQHGRDLPWRHTRDPYAILVSEFMLQQTQVATVIPYYDRWLRRFPDFATLSASSENDVLHAWQGLGYYARARNLHTTARAIENRHLGTFPDRIEKMRELPGVGKYTAHAVASFAFDQAVPIVEANTARVLARLFDVQTPIDQSTGRAALWNHAAELVPKRNPARFNSALVDLGALVCLPRKPKCNICPVKEFCRTTDPQSLPIRKPRPVLKKLAENHVLVISRSKILLEQSRARWRGMWVLPSLKLDGLKPSSSWRRPVYQAAFPFTHHQITLKVFRRRARRIGNRTQRWFPMCALDSIPIPSPHRRAIRALLQT